MKGLFSLLESDTLASLVRTFVARGVAALGSLVLLVVVGQYFGPVGVGLLAISQSILLGAGIVAKNGVDSALMRYVGQDHNSPQVISFLGWSVKQAVILSALLSFAVFYWRGSLASAFGAAGLSEILSGVAFAIPFFTISYVFSGFFKGVRKPATACLMENGLVSMLAAGVVLVFSSTIGTAISYNFIGYAFFIACFLVFLQGAVQLFLWNKGRSEHLSNVAVSGGRPSSSAPLAFGEGAVSKTQFFQTSRAFFAVNLAQFMQNVVAIMVAGWLLTSSDLGLFRTAQQVGLLIAFILMVLNAIFPPKFASLYKKGDISGLSKTAKAGSALGLVFVTPLVALCILFPEWVLSWFGDEFLPAAKLLMLIAFGQLINVVTGSVGFLLSMTGHEKLMRNIALICNALGLMLFYVFISLFGVLGAALALMFVLVSQNITALVFVWIKLGIWTLPIPNLMSLVGVRTQANGV